MRACVTLSYFALEWEINIYSLKRICKIRACVCVCVCVGKSTHIQTHVLWQFFRSISLFLYIFILTSYKSTLVVDLKKIILIYVKIHCIFTNIALKIEPKNLKRENKNMEELNEFPYITCSATHMHTNIHLKYIRAPHILLQDTFGSRFDSPCYRIGTYILSSFGIPLLLSTVSHILYILFLLRELYRSLWFWLCWWYDSE